MTAKVEESVKRLHELALSMPRPDCGWEERPRFDPPASPTLIANFERTVGFDLPMEFKTFLSLAGAVIGMDVHNGYWLGGIENVDLSAYPQEVFGEKVAPVATDGGGNTFLMTANGKVRQRNHETGELNEVAESFASFLERVAADWAAYLNDTLGWKYLV